MIEKCEEIKNSALNAFNVTVKTPTSEGQQLELWCQTRKIIYQKEVKSEGNHLENAEVFRKTTGNVTKRLKLRILT